jgi:hypothetical protein
MSQSVSILTLYYQYEFSESADGGFIRKVMHHLNHTCGVGHPFCTTFCTAAHLVRSKKNK